MGRLIFSVIVSILILTSFCLARTWNVPSSECPTIQAGIDSASVGDTVLVAAGTYTGEGNKNLDFGGTDLVLLSAAGPDLTIIDCEESGRGFFLIRGETGAAVVEGFTVTNGYVLGGWTESCGGGMFCYDSSPTVRRCIFSSNSTTEDGGGMYCFSASPNVSSCTFSGNSASIGGGGMSCFESSFPTVSNCTFSQNSSTAGWGGGMLCWMSSSPTVSNCTFLANSAYGGSGVYCYDSAYPLIENTIIAFSPAGEAIRCESGAVATLNCCDVYGNAGGDWVDCIADQLGINGNISGDPLFCDSTGDGCYLECSSPCAPAQQPGCGLIGAWPVDCGASRTESTTWGSIKSVYR